MPRFETTLNPNPFAYDPATTPSFQQGGNNPFAQQAHDQSGNNPNPFQLQPDIQPRMYDVNPFAPQGAEQSYPGFSAEQQTQKEAMDGRPRLSERLRQKIDTVINVGNRAVRSLMDRASGDTFAAQAAGHVDVLRQQYPVQSAAMQGFNQMRQTTGNMWDNRSQVIEDPRFQKAMEVGKDVGMAGIGGAMNHLSHETGVSFEDGLKIKKSKLARFAFKTATAPYATVGNTLRGAATAGVGAAKQEAWGQFNTARQDVKNAAWGR